VLAAVSDSLRRSSVLEIINAARAQKRGSRSRRASRLTVHESAKFRPDPSLQEHSDRSNCTAAGFNKFGRCFDPMNLFRILIKTL
jgi:hypothetical protein